MSELNPVEPTEDLLSEDFRSFLNQRYGTPPAVAASVDEEVLRRAKQQLVAGTEGSVAKSGGAESGGDVRLRNGTFWRYAAVLSSLVAVCSLFMLSLWNVQDAGEDSRSISNVSRENVSRESDSRVAASATPAPETTMEAQGPVISGDEDRSGKVNILDAFALARVIRAGRNPNLRSDMNGDGRVDDQDVDLIAYRAVAL